MSSSADALASFYAQHDISDPNSPPPYRFVRLNLRFDQQETLEKLKDEVNQAPFPLAVPWLAGFYALPGLFPLQKSPCYQTARVYGQDVSSGAAVAALMSDTHDDQVQTLPSDKKKKKESTVVNATHRRVLDLCCCPGLKLCAIADYLQYQKTIPEDHRHQQRQQQHVVVGVDISEHRMAVCKRVLHKYQVAASSTLATEHADKEKPCHRTANVRIRLYCNDGTTFGASKDEMNLVFDSNIASEDVKGRSGKRKRMNKSARARERKRLKETLAFDLTTSFAAEPTDSCVQEDHCPLALFDCVLVDAECSTDGSLVHLQKWATREREGDSTKLAAKSNPKLTDKQQLAELVTLQKKLARTGFRLLKEGGHMVYSTCSLSEEQNECVVNSLLDEFSDARVVPVDFLKIVSASCTSFTKEEARKFVKAGAIPGTVRFLPNTIQARPTVIDEYQLFGGGFFLAKITKLP